MILLDFGYDGHENTVSSPRTPSRLGRRWPDSHWASAFFASASTSTRRVEDDSGAGGEMASRRTLSAFHSTLSRLLRADRLLASQRVALYVEAHRSSNHIVHCAALARARSSSHWNVSRTYPDDFPERARDHLTGRPGMCRRDLGQHRQSNWSEPIVHTAQHSDELEISSQILMRGYAKVASMTVPADPCGQVECGPGHCAFRMRQSVAQNFMNDLHLQMPLSRTSSHPALPRPSPPIQRPKPQPNRRSTR